jgi:dual specificity phosphatase 12
MHYRIPVQDAENVDLLVELPRACSFIATALAQGRNVLIHSVRGQNRAAAVATAYCKGYNQTAVLPSTHDFFYYQQ